MATHLIRWVKQTNQAQLNAVILQLYIKNIDIYIHIYTIFVLQLWSL